MIAKNKHIPLGQFGKTFGVLGWLRLYSYTDPIENILNYATLKIENKQHIENIQIQSSKRKDNYLLVKLANCNTPEAAQLYTNKEIFVYREELPPLEQKEFYWQDLIGCTVINNDQKELGILTEILNTKANDVLVIKNESGKETLIPCLPSTIKEINIEKNYILVNG